MDGALKEACIRIQIEQSHHMPFRGWRRAGSEMERKIHGGCSEAQSVSSNRDLHTQFSLEQSDQMIYYINYRFTKLNHGVN